MKKRILDEFIASTGYQRKYAISLLNQSKLPISAAKEAKKISKRK
ncbi:hypothetical protein [Legionella maceachernii]|nr:hypothetical protein [Legionella maceachernii]SKA18906.1 hypothetical protein SAMN02745128_02451 [Legionella maceachernii]SUP04465.1 Uncharacterised protein [Legionella maceachernii]